MPIPSDSNAPYQRRRRRRSIQLVIEMPIPSDSNAPYQRRRRRRTIQLVIEMQEGGKDACTRATND
jgi:hypothetical protein